MSHVRRRPSQGAITRKRQRKRTLIGITLILVIGLSILLGIVLLIMSMPS